MARAERRVGRARTFWECLGPGILLAATSIGASHLVMAPQAGALFGVSLLWLVPLAHLLKYPAFEFGPRYAVATGESLLAGYARASGPKRWAVWVFLGSTVLQGVGVLAGVVGIAAAVLASYVGQLAVPAWGGVVLALVVALLVAGGFGWLDGLNKAMMAVLALATALAAFVEPLPPGTATGLVLPRLPEGSLPLAAAILGWMPTGLDVSVWHSLWALEKGRRLDAAGVVTAERPAEERLRLALVDMRCGYGLSVAIALAFVLLGAEHLRDRGADMLGAQFPSALAEAYGAALGDWMFHLFFVAAFFAMFSTCYAVIDGFSRSFEEALAVLRQRPASRAHYWGFALGSAAVALVTLATVGNPVTLVLAVAVVSLSIAPVLYGLNTYCVWRLIPDPSLRPSRVTVVLALVGACFMAVVAGLFVWVKLA